MGVKTLNKIECHFTLNAANNSHSRRDTQKKQGVERSGRHYEGYLNGLCINYLLKNDFKKKRLPCDKTQPSFT